MCFRGRYTKANFEEFVEKVSHAMGNRWRNIIQRIASTRASIKKRVWQLQRLVSRRSPACYSTFVKALNVLRSRSLLRKISRSNTIVEKEPVYVAGPERIVHAREALDVANRHLSTPNASVSWALEHATTGVNIVPRTETLADRLQNSLTSSQPDFCDATSLWDLLSPSERNAIFQEDPRTWAGESGRVGRSKCGLFLLLSDHLWVHGKDPYPHVRQNLGFSRYPQEWTYRGHPLATAACERQQCRCPRSKRTFFGEYMTMPVEVYWNRILGRKD